MAVTGQISPGARLIVLLILLEILKSGLGIALNAAWSRASTAPTSPQAATSAVSRSAHSVADSPELLDGYRYVAAQVLAVRLNPKARAPQLGQLRFGHVVEVLDKNQDFALVRWQGGDGHAEIQGWVFARYLKKFK